MDRVSVKRMCAGREFQVEGADTEKAREKKLLSNTGWSGKEISIGRTQGFGRKIVRNEFREVERLRGMKCFPGTLYKYQLSPIDLRDEIVLETKLRDYCDKLQRSSVGTRRYFQLNS